jgi:hypothetical protein
MQALSAWEAQVEPIIDSVLRRRIVINNDPFDCTLARKFAPTQRMV